MFNNLSNKSVDGYSKYLVIYTFLNITNAVYFVCSYPSGQFVMYIRTNVLCIGGFMIQGSGAIMSFLIESTYWLCKVKKFKKGPFKCYLTFFMEI